MMRSPASPYSSPSPSSLASRHDSSNSNTIATSSRTVVLSHMANKEMKATSSTTTTITTDDGSRRIGSNNTRLATGSSITSPHLIPRTNYLGEGGIGGGFVSRSSAAYSSPSPPSRDRVREAMDRVARVHSIRTMENTVRSIQEKAAAAAATESATTTKTTMKMKTRASSPGAVASTTAKDKIVKSATSGGPYEKRVLEALAHVRSQKPTQKKAKKKKGDGIAVPEHLKKLIQQQPEAMLEPGVGREERSSFKKHGPSSTSSSTTAVPSMGRIQNPDIMMHDHHQRASVAGSSSFSSLRTPTNSKAARFDLLHVLSSESQMSLDPQTMSNVANLIDSINHSTGASITTMKNDDSMEYKSIGSSFSSAYHHHQYRPEQLSPSSNVESTGTTQSSYASSLASSILREAVSEGLETRVYRTRHHHFHPSSPSSHRGTGAPGGAPPPPSLLTSPHVRLPISSESLSPATMTESIRDSGGDDNRGIYASRMGLPTTTMSSLTESRIKLPLLPSEHVPDRGQSSSSPSPRLLSGNDETRSSVAHVDGGASLLSHGSTLRQFSEGRRLASPGMSESTVARHSKQQMSPGSASAAFPPLASSVIAQSTAYGRSVTHPIAPEQETALLTKSKVDQLIAARKTRTIPKEGLTSVQPSSTECGYVSPLSPSESTENSPTIAVASTYNQHQSAKGAVSRNDCHDVLLDSRLSVLSSTSSGNVQDNQPSAASPRFSSPIDKQLMSPTTSQFEQHPKPTSPPLGDGYRSSSKTSQPNSPTNFGGRQDATPTSLSPAPEGRYLLRVLSSESDVSLDPRTLANVSRYIDTLQAAPQSNQQRVAEMHDPPGGKGAVSDASFAPMTDEKMSRERETTTAETNDGWVETCRTPPLATALCPEQQGGPDFVQPPTSYSTAAKTDACRQGETSTGKTDDGRAESDTTRDAGALREDDAWRKGDTATTQMEGGRADSRKTRCARALEYDETGRKVEATGEPGWSHDLGARETLETLTVTMDGEWAESGRTRDAGALREEDEAWRHKTSSANMDEGKGEYDWEPVSCRGKEDGTPCDQLHPSSCCNKKPVTRVRNSRYGVRVALDRDSVEIQIGQAQPSEDGTESQEGKDVVESSSASSDDLKTTGLKSETLAGIANYIDTMTSSKKEASISGVEVAIERQGRAVEMIMSSEELGDFVHDAEAFANDGEETTFPVVNVSSGSAELHSRESLEDEKETRSPRLGVLSVESDGIEVLSQEAVPAHREVLPGRMEPVGWNADTPDSMHTTMVMKPNERCARKGVDGTDSDNLDVLSVESYGIEVSPEKAEMPLPDGAPGDFGSATNELTVSACNRGEADSVWEVTQEANDVVQTQRDVEETDGKQLRRVKQEAVSVGVLSFESDGVEVLSVGAPLLGAADPSKENPLGHIVLHQAQPSDSNFQIAPFKAALPGDDPPGGKAQRRARIDPPSYLRSSSEESYRPEDPPCSNEDSIIVACEDSTIVSIVTEGVETIASSKPEMYGALLKRELLPRVEIDTTRCNNETELSAAEGRNNGFHPSITDDALELLAEFPSESSRSVGLDAETAVRTSYTLSPIEHISEAGSEEKKDDGMMLSNQALEQIRVQASKGRDAWEIQGVAAQDPDGASPFSASREVGSFSDTRDDDDDTTKTGRRRTEHVDALIESTTFLRLIDLLTGANVNIDEISCFARLLLFAFPLVDGKEPSADAVDLIVYEAEKMCLPVNAVDRFLRMVKSLAREDRNFIESAPSDELRSMKEREALLLENEKLARFLGRLVSMSESKGNFEKKSTEGDSVAQEHRYLLERVKSESTEQVVDGNHRQDNAGGEGDALESEEAVEVDLRQGFMKKEFAPSDNVDEPWWEIAARLSESDENFDPIKAHESYGRNTIHPQESIDDKSSAVESVDTVDGSIDVNASLTGGDDSQSSIQETEKACTGRNNWDEGMRRQEENESLKADTMQTSVSGKLSGLDPASPSAGMTIRWGLQTISSTAATHEKPEALWSRRLGMAKWKKHNQWRLGALAEKNPSVGEPVPINAVRTAVCFYRNSVCMGVWDDRPRCQQWKRTYERRTQAHDGYYFVDVFSLCETAMTFSPEHKLDSEPWEHRLVRQHFLYEQSLSFNRNWFGSLRVKQGNKKVDQPICQPKSMEMPMRAGEWTEEWYAKPWINPALSNLSDEANAVQQEYARYRIAVDGEDDEVGSWEDTPECGRIKNTNLRIGERTSRVTPDLTSSLRKSRWRRKYFPRGTFPY